MTDWHEVTGRVEESTDEEWREVVETEYDGIGNLVRTTVGRGIDGRHGDGSESPTFSELLESLRNPYE